MQRILKSLLLMFAIILTFLCIKSVSNYIGFSNEKKKREIAVFEQMMCIKEVEKCFFQQHGIYTSNVDSLFLYCEKLNHCNCECDSIMYIPFSNGKTFDISIEKKMEETTGEYVDIIEIKAPYTTYLYDLSEDEISSLQTQSLQSGSYPGLTFTVR